MNHVCYSNSQHEGFQFGEMNEIQGQYIQSLSLLYSASDFHLSYLVITTEGDFCSDTRNVIYHMLT